jgi:sec-independent protein translocase protein TatC
MGSIFFVGGGAFGFYIVIPTAFEYLTGLVPATVAATYSVELYFSLVIRLLLAFGLVFELPLIMWILSAAGIVNPDTYSKLRKYWAVAAVVLGAMLTDPSPLTQAMMAVPLLLFWELGIIGGRILYRRRRGESSA